jgi:nicotinamide phosphoribosyltransferase
MKTLKMENSILINTDSYKVSMWKQYPPGTEYVYSYIESRGGLYDKTVFFGLQSYLQEYLTNPITQEEIDFADEFWTAHGEPFNRTGWEYILKKHGGILPLAVRAVPEGTVLATKNVLATVVNTDSMVPWLTTWVEQGMLRAIWYGTTVATQSFFIKRVIKTYLEKSGDVAGLPFKLHDFGGRGVSSNESAMLGGMAHLVNFSGTDTAVALIGANRYYDADMKATAFSIPASEHSTITSWGRENETMSYRNMVDQFGKKGSIFAVVSDSYDIYEACRKWGLELKEQIVNSGATLVIRPDSGDPLVVLPKMFDILGALFGFTTNEKGYKVLNNIRILWGDGINGQSISSILRNIVDLRGWSADNIAFGMGGALLQIVNRDTLKFAMKASAIFIRLGDHIEWRDVYKDPITDPGKASKRGVVTLWHSGSDFESSVTRPNRWVDNGTEWKEATRTVFFNGELMNKSTFEEVRATAASYL